jgi:hypothetical protein
MSGAAVPARWSPTGGKARVLFLCITNPRNEKQNLVMANGRLAIGYSPGQIGRAHV